MIGRPPKMVNLQLHPLEVNLKTGEPFLRLRHHKNIILTPPREEDAEAFIPLLNDPRVDGLAGPPYPYTLGKLVSLRSFKGGWVADIRE